jgi:flagellar protein FliL
LAGEEAQGDMVSFAERRKSILSFLGILAAMTLIAVGIGGGLGFILAGRATTLAEDEIHRISTDVPPKYGPDMTLLDLPPIITNLADPTSAWIRLQAAIVYDNKAVAKPQMLAAEIGEDILAYMKTVTLAQIGGASGLEHLREDLNERAAIRSEGHVREVIIQTVVVQ